MNIPSDCLSTQANNPNTKIQEKADAFDSLMDQLKTKLASLSNSKSKIQILTLVPTNYTIARVSKSLPSEALSALSMFYHEEEYSRQLPGKKDFIGILKTKKRLILCNLKELYSASYPTLKVGFSQFCVHRP